MNQLRQIRIDGDIAYIPLTKGYEALIDAEDVSFVTGVNWNAKVIKRKDGSVWNVYAKRTVGNKHIFLHRLLTNAGTSTAIDHISGCGLDNRKSNLRIATYSQNQHNQKLNIKNTSGHKGVYWNKNRRKWSVMIALNKKRHFLGNYESIDDAKNAYAKGSAALHGEFGRAI